MCVYIYILNDQVGANLLSFNKLNISPLNCVIGDLSIACCSLLKELSFIYNVMCRYTDINKVASTIRPF